MTLFVICYMLETQATLSFYLAKAHLPHMLLEHLLGHDEHGGPSLKGCPQSRFCPVT